MIKHDARWIVENIFTHKCAHCDESDWRKIGCNRIDNDLPHIKSNVEPCCKKCNDELAATEKVKTVYQYTLDGKLVRVWEKLSDISKEFKYCISSISLCCRGICKQAYGYIWSYMPIN